MLFGTGYSDPGGNGTLSLGSKRYHIIQAGTALKVLSTAYYKTFSMYFKFVGEPWC